MVLYTEDSSGGYKFWKRLSSFTTKFDVVSFHVSDKLIDDILSGHGGLVGTALGSGDTVLVALDAGTSISESLTRSNRYAKALSILSEEYPSNLYEVELSCFEQILLSSDRMLDLVLATDMVPLAKLLGYASFTIIGNTEEVLIRILEDSGVLVEAENFSMERLCYLIYKKVTTGTCFRYTAGKKDLPKYWKFDCCSGENNNNTCRDVGHSMELRAKYLEALTNSVLSRPLLHSFTERLSFAELLSRQA